MPAQCFKCTGILHRCRSVTRDSCQVVSLMDVKTADTVRWPPSVVDSHVTINPRSVWSRTRKALARGRTDHVAAAVTYSQFPNHARFSATLPELVFPSSLSLLAEKRTFSSSDFVLQLMILIYEFNIDRIQVNHHAKYLRKWSFGSKSIVRTHTDTSFFIHSTSYTLLQQLNWLPTEYRILTSR